MAPPGPAHPHELRFGDLGPLTVLIDGVERAPGGPRPAAALALLLINANRRVSGDALREAMWGAATGEHAASTLDTHLFRLRKVVEPGRRAGQPPSVVVAEPGGYRLVVAPDQVDSIRFAKLASDAAELLRTGQADRARRKSEEALVLWRGRPFDPVAHEVWAVPAVTRLLEVHAQLLETQLQALLDSGEPDRVLRDAEPILAEHPLRERLWALRMLAAVRCGRVDDALDTYQRARRRLRDDLGIEPGAELRDLQNAVLTGADRRPAPPARTAPAGPVALPRRTGSLFGRSAELGLVRSSCLTSPLVTVVGAGGCGKTRLAVEAAMGLGEEFVDGVHFVDLTPVPDADQVADAVVSVLGLAPASTGRPVDVLRAFLRDRRLLLVLDNCEHVIDGAAELVEELLVPGTEMAVLATSREPLQVPGEVVLTVPPLPVPDPDDGFTDPAEVAGSPAVRLFLERAGSALPDDPATAIEVARICRSVDGVPLAVELAAGRVRAFSLTEIVRQVAGDPAALGQVRRGAPAHQQSVGLAVEWSHRMLTTTEQLVHRRIACVAGPFTVAVAARISGLPTGETESVLAGLVHKSMVVALGPARPAGPSQFAQLATIRAHGLHELATHHEAEAARRLRNEWVARLIAAKPRAGHRDERSWFDRVQDDFACVRATLHDTLRRQPDPLGPLVVGRLIMFSYFRGLVPEFARWCALGQEVTGALAIDRAIVTLGLGSARGLAQRMDLAAPLIQEGLRIGADRTPDQDVLFGDTLVEVAGGMMLGGDQASAADLTRRALRIAERHDDGWLDLSARARLALNPMDAAADGAPDIFQEALEREHHYAAYLAANGAMMRAIALGDPAAGLSWSDRIVTLNREQGIGQGPSVLEIRANLLVLVGEPVEAVKLYSAARFHNSRAGLPWPSREVTAGLLARATAEVDRTRFEDAWQAGRDLTLADVEVPDRVRSDVFG